MIELQGNLLQGVTASLFLVFLVGVIGWELYSTARAKKRRIAREQAQKAAAGTENGGR